MAKKKLSDSLYENEVDMYELYHKVSTLEKENSDLIKKLNKDIEVQNLFEMIKSLENNMAKQSESFDALQFENIRLEHELKLEKEKIQGSTIGAGKIDKMLNFGKLFGDKRGLGYINESSTSSSFETIFVKDVSTREAPKFVHGLNLGFDSMNIVSKGKLSPLQSKFVPTCHHCGVKGHIRPRCHILRIESLRLMCHLLRGHIRPKCFELRNFEQKPFVHFKKVNDDSLQTQVNDLLYKVVKIPKVISLPHKVSKVKEVWIKKEDHVRPHFGD
ncbi:unnamed protein product [Prunus armeniaca]